MHTRRALREAIDAATRTLADAGVDSARVNAQELAAHVAGVDRGRLSLLDEAPHDFWERYRALVEARSRRVPLQHLIGLAPFGQLLLNVGPGVFVPRPETESLLDWALSALRSIGVRTHPIIVDVCTGTGALALALAHHRPDATVIGIDHSAEALRYAARNAAGTTVELVSADATEPGLLPHLDGSVDLVISNPPYIPDGAHLEPEVAEHDPQDALFGGPDGMTVIGAVVQLAARWLRPGGLFAVEHDDTTSRRTAELVADTGSFEDITQRTDLAGRPRFVTAVRLSGQEGGGRS